MAIINRPLSPHLKIYKPQLTSLLSITHRGTGLFLSLGLLFLPCWLVSIAAGPAHYAQLQVYLLSWYGKCLLIALIFSLYYHLANGVRHLFWDIGLGLALKTTYKSGYAVIISAVLLTIVTVSTAGIV